MKTICWDDSGASLEIVRSINGRIPFVVVVSGPLAKALVATLGAGPVGISPETVRILIAVLSILAVAGLVLFALAKGYKVSGKTRAPDGTEYEISFEPPET